MGDSSNMVMVHTQAMPTGGAKVSLLKGVLVMVLVILLLLTSSKILLSLRVAVQTDQRALIMKC